MIDDQISALLGESEYIVGFDSSRLPNLSNDEFTKEYAQLDLRPTPTLQAEDMKEKMMIYYKKELLFRIAHEKIHPDDFEKLYEKYLEELGPKW